MNSNISDKDKKAWQNFLSSKEKLQDKDSRNTNEKFNKSITFDLHGYSLDDANKKIKDLILNAYTNEVKKLIIVTGKGIHSENDKDPYISKDFGILKHSVPEYVKGNSELMSMINEIQDASVKDGGSGAFYIFLKKKIIK